MHRQEKQWAWCMKIKAKLHMTMVNLSTHTTAIESSDEHASYNKMAGFRTGKYNTSTSPASTTAPTGHKPLTKHRTKGAKTHFTTPSLNNYINASKQTASSPAH
jgi:hypothetical protein